MVGLVTTAATYAAFRAALSLGLHYLLASTISWMFGMAVSYACNRRFTFAVRRQASLREAGRFLSGGIVQCLIASAGYVLMMGVLHLNATLAFLINVGVGCVFNFCYMRWIVFSPRFSQRDGSRLSSGAAL